MNETSVLSLRLKPEIKDRLARIAKATKRSQSFLAAEAIEEFVELHEWQIEGINKALKEVGRGEVIEHEDAMAWVRSLGTDNPLPMPDPKALGRAKTKRGV